MNGIFVLETDFKSELVAWLNSYGSINGNIQYSAKIKNLKKKKSTKEIVFVKDSAHKLAAQNPFFKKGKVLTSDGLASNSPVAPPKFRQTANPKALKPRPTVTIHQKGFALRGTTRAAAGFKNQANVPGISQPVVFNDPSEHAPAGLPAAIGGPGGRALPAPGGGQPKGGPVRGGPAPVRGAPGRGAPGVGGKAPGGFPGRGRG